MNTLPAYNDPCNVKNRYTVNKTRIRRCGKTSLNSTNVKEELYLTIIDGIFGTVGCPKMVKTVRLNKL